MNSEPLARTQLVLSVLGSLAVLATFCFYVAHSAEARRQLESEGQEGQALLWLVLPAYPALSLAALACAVWVRPLWWRIVLVGLSLVAPIEWLIQYSETFLSST